MKPATTSVFGNPQQQQQQQQPSTSTSNFSNPSALGQSQQQAPNPFGNFGQNQQQNQQQTGSIFGQPQQNQQTLPPGTLFGQPQQQQNQQTLPPGTLFGQPQQQQNQQTLPPGTLFGQPQQQQNQQTLPPGSLFGQPQQQQNQQTLPPGSLFGQPQQQPQQQTNSIFGGSIFGTNSNANTTNPQPQQQQNPFGLSAFGGTNQQQPQAQQSNLFGSTNNNTNPLQAQATLPSGAFNTGGNNAFAASSLFGNKSQQPQQQQQQFGYNNQAQNTGFSSLGQSNAAQYGPPPFTKSTKFNDLPDDIKRVLENIDAHIQGRIQISKDLQQRKLGEEPTKGHEAIRKLHQDLVNTATTLRNDHHLTQDLKAKVDQAVEDTIAATRIIDGFRNPQSGNTYLKDHASFPLEYFSRVTNQMKERMAWYKTTIEQIERKLSSSASTAQTPQGISATLQAQHSTFLALASKTAAVDAELQKIKVLYTQLWRAKTGSVRDPFNDGVLKSSETGADFGLGSLNVR
ncbi:hypothetical protein B0H34DRAFT_729934 [Crassisporium funariophilum]|nr:hypothetical protein B0H34DRAFT_729934 [Crassisporium funariophilum]